MRMMGKRMASQLSRNEMIAMVSLAAAIGVPLQAPDRGILAAVVIAFVVILIQQVTAILATRNQRLESITQGDLSVLIADSKLNLDQMQMTGITREKAYSQLRSSGIRHLGEVKRLYFEAGGAFTLIRNTDVRPGLVILPDVDADFMGQVCSASQVIICKRCGQEFAQEEAGTVCGNCGSGERTRAVQ